MRTFLLFAVAAAVQAAGCSSNPQEPMAASVAVGTEASSPANPAEQPETGAAADSLIALMGPLQGKVVADMFAGNGYYTWKLLAAGARVLALDDDPGAIARLQAWKASQGIGDDRLLIRQTTPGNPGLMADEADLALVTREFSTLPDREAWVNQLMAGIKSPHTFYLVNYFPVQTVDGPPLAQRMGYNAVSDELTNMGVQDIGIYYKKLPNRWVIFGSNPPVVLDPSEN